MKQRLFSIERMYVYRFHRVCFTKSSSLEQLHTQFFQLELLDLATCRFRISFHIEDVGWGFKIESVSHHVRHIRINMTYQDDGSTVL